MAPATVYYSQATRKLDLSWHGHFENSVGTLRLTDSTDVGNVIFALPDGTGECIGTFTYATKTAGRWSAKCPGKAAAEGMFELSRNGGYGRGEDAVGNEVSFVLGPIKR